MVVINFMNQKDFARRLSDLRLQRGVSARDMSISIGQSESYINKLENNESLPSMKVFFSICKYLKLTPAQFFDDSLENPEIINKIINNLKRLDRKQLENINSIIEAIK